MTTVLRRPAGGATTFSRRDQFLAVSFGAWLVVGLFLDGWAHNHDKPETIFTPWHAVFYSGFLACAIHAARVARRSPPPDLPPGMGLTLVGLGIFAVGGASDLAWHSLFGIERNLAALLSPTHLVMFCGALLILTGPFRAAWADGRSRAPSLPEFLPGLLSLTLATALVAFFFMYLTPFRTDVFGRWVNGTDMADDLRVRGVASILVTDVVYVGALLLVLRRWRPPFWTATLLLTSVTLLIGAIDAFDRAPLLFAAPIAGLIVDALILWFNPSVDRPWALRGVAAAMPVLLWIAFFALYQSTYGVGFSAELWAGSIFLSDLAGAGLSLLVAPPAIPVTGG